MNLCEVVDAAVAAVPERVALVVDDRAVLYREVADAIGRAAASLTALGVGRGDRVALAGGCGVGAVATVLGAARIGAAAAPMSPALTAGEMRALVHAARCGPVGVADAGAGEALAAAIGGRTLNEGEVLDGDARAASAPVPDAEDEFAVVLFTGGTTGAPKPVPLTHGTLVARVRGFAAPPDPTTEPATALMCVPFHHVAGLVGTLVGLAGGSTSVVQRRFDAGEWLKLVERHRVGRAFLVPTMLSRIVSHPSFDDADLGSLAMITYGAAPAPPELIERAVAALPHVAFVNVFGQTETLGAVTALGPDEHRAGRAGSVGRPMPGVEVRIVDPATGVDVADGEIGELWVNTPHTFRPGWMRTGDLVRRDADGYLYATGRLSEMINRAGEKISPDEIEAVLRLHPAIVQAAVVGVPDAEMGERVGAVVVAREALDPSLLRAWCRERLAAYKSPERFAFIDALPLTELGKVSRRALRELFGGAS